MKKDINDSRARVRVIQDEEARLDSQRRVLVAERNEIAYRTAHTFVAIDAGREVAVYGVSDVTPAQREDGLVIFSGNNRLCANITYAPVPGSEVCITVPVNQTVRFQIARGGRTDSTFYCARSFSTSKAAGRYASERNRENSRNR